MARYNGILTERSGDCNKKRRLAEKFTAGTEIFTNQQNRTNKILRIFCTDTTNLAFCLYLTDYILLFVRKGHN